jgi:hypothetical protein
MFSLTKDALSLPFYFPLRPEPGQMGGAEPWRSIHLLLPWSNLQQLFLVKDRFTHAFRGLICTQYSMPKCERRLKKLFFSSNLQYSFQLSSAQN